MKNRNLGLSIKTYLSRLFRINLETALQDDKVMQDFELESLTIGVNIQWCQLKQLLAVITPKIVSIYHLQLSFRGLNTKNTKKRRHKEFKLS